MFLLFFMGFLVFICTVVLMWTTCHLFKKKKKNEAMPLHSCFVYHKAGQNITVFTCLKIASIWSKCGASSSNVSNDASANQSYENNKHNASSKLLYTYIIYQEATFSVYCWVSVKTCWNVVKLYWNKKMSMFRYSNTFYMYINEKRQSRRYNFTQGLTE
jgi:hypothetical protein